MVQIRTIDHKLLEFTDKKGLTAIMSKNYRLKIVINKLEVICCGPLYFTVPL